MPDIKIIDFGLSQTLKKQQYESNTYVGTLMYMPPEGLDGILSTKWDIWSLGITLFMLIGNDVPYNYEKNE